MSKHHLEDVLVPVLVTPMGLVKGASAKIWQTIRQNQGERYARNRRASIAAYLTGAMYEPGKRFHLEVEL